MTVNTGAAIAILLAGIALGGCGGIVDPSVGRGEVTLGPEAERAFVDYQALDKPRYFALAENGEAYYYSFCDESRCLKQVKAQVINKCETYSNGIPCHIYASHGNIVWMKDS